MSVHILDALAREGFEQVAALHDRSSGLRAFLAIHDACRLPAFGGVRRWSYLDEEQALRDCLRLARSMTYKCLMAGLDAGGGKIVVLDTPDLDLESSYGFLGEHVEKLQGRFYAGPDVGTGPRELAWMCARSRYVAAPGEQGPGELPEATSAGVVAGIAAALRHLDGEEGWPRRTVLVQGLGGVGSRLARALRELGARVLAVESDAARADQVAGELDVELVDESSALEIDCDVFAPCALGGILHDLSVKRLRCRVVAGAANNVLASSTHGRRLRELGILYVPDFVINAGALIRGATYYALGTRVPVEEIAARIGRTTAEVLRKADERGLAPFDAAVQEAENRLAQRRSRAGGGDRAGARARGGDGRGDPT